ncbi:uncharacterized protein LOC107227655 [Neodiprion lecontei]|uniref:Uncharacterized protein LOC107227655 n=1 Tax=Neodiprion lecontei TaxID=441921 RepID=A0A6J0CCE7_NEOLC|nr:uncharacterized protein LOC107227655 [Neodiprion lecontei]
MGVAAAFGRLMLNIAEPAYVKSELLESVTYSGALYGASVWADALSVARNMSRLEAARKASALRVVSAYRTVSTRAVMLLAGLILLHQMAVERKRIAEVEVRSGARGKAARVRLRR